MFFSRCLVFCVIFGIAASKNEIYKGSKVYSVKLITSDQQEMLSTIKNDLIDFWRKPNYKHNIDGLAMVPQSAIDWFEEKLTEINAKKEIYIEDVYEYLMKNDDSLLTREATTRQFGYDGYYRFGEILEYLNEKAENSTNIEVIQYGLTAEGRQLSYVKLGNNPNIVKPVIFIEAGIIPREWITISAAVNIIDQVLENEQGLLDVFDWIVIPVANPDGYEYTHTDSRLWTKSLTTSSNLGFICPGVNINRNFDVDFQNFDSSSSPCSHLYSGDQPYSEIETKMIRDLVTEYQDCIRLYISLQSSGGFISYPWSYENAASGMFIQHHRIGFAMAEALNNTDYTIGPTSLVVGDRASGTSNDYVQQTGVLYSLTLDVKPDSVTNVIIPVNEIGGIVDDVWRAVVVAASSFI